MRNPTTTWMVAAALTVSLAGGVAPARAVIGTIDAVPAATLLLPYFEVDLDNPDGLTTLFSINNASATAVLAHVTMWTNWSQPTIDFDIYLTGYDVQTINLRDIFNGDLPITASAGQDPTDTISPHGPISQDINFASCNFNLPYPDNVLIGTTAYSRLLNGHTGNPVPSLGGRCLGADLGDNVARGYITVDTVNACNLLFPDDPGYFINGGAGFATLQNVLWGDYFIVDATNNFSFGENLVHIEANAQMTALSVPLQDPNSGATIGVVPNATGYTFYGRYTALASGSDNREPLGTVWATRYLNGGAFTGGTDLIVWRDSTANDQPNNGFVCGVGPTWFPLNEWEIVAFDEQEDAVEICAPVGGIISPPDFNDPACFPYETGRYPFGVEPLEVPFNFGWAHLNLNIPPDAPIGDVDFGTSGLIAQSYVTATHNAEGRFQVGLPAVELWHALQDFNPELNGFGSLPNF